MDVSGRWVMDEFFFQIDGLRSLEIMENVARCDLHDLKFAQNKQIEIAGTPVTIHRLGMSGCLAYEMHGAWGKAEDVYAAIMEGGKEYGLRQLGIGQYPRNHTQSGYPNQNIHYWYPWFSSSPEMTDYFMNRCDYFNTRMPKVYPFIGSAAGDPQNAFVTPFDVKWDYLINYDHDFIGKKALLEIRKDPPRTVVTLEWDADDVGKVLASQFKGTEHMPTDDISAVGDGGAGPFTMSKVMDDEQMIGVATGRTRDNYHRRMHFHVRSMRKNCAAVNKE